ncbi:hypothetical protein BC829DRAFT_441612 [Chytridium lagenaria]|nr:hypothetical protein BC829DRAFT_441612 [Chytridium lagenaria]
MCGRGRNVAPWSSTLHDARPRLPPSPQRLHPRDEIHIQEIISGSIALQRLKKEATATSQELAILGCFMLQRGVAAPWNVGGSGATGLNEFYDGWCGLVEESVVGASVSEDSGAETQTKETLRRYRFGNLRELKRVKSTLELLNDVKSALSKEKGKYKLLIDLLIEYSKGSLHLHLVLPLPPPPTSSPPTQTSQTPPPSPQTSRTKPPPITTSAAERPRRVRSALDRSQPSPTPPLSAQEEKKTVKTYAPTVAFNTRKAVLTRKNEEEGGRETTPPALKVKKNAGSPGKIVKKGGASPVVKASKAPASPVVNQKPASPITRVQEGYYTSVVVFRREFEEMVECFEGREREACGKLRTYFGNMVEGRGRGRRRDSGGVGGEKRGRDEEEETGGGARRRKSGK